MELLDHALRCEETLGYYAYVAPYLRQAKAICWMRLKQRIDPLIRTGAVDISEQDLAVVFRTNGATIRLIGADNPDALRGIRLDGVVIDEVAQIRPEVWTDILQPALSDRKGWALFIGTPSGTNLFSELFFRAPSSDWWTARYTVDDTDALDPDEVERLRRDMPPTAFAREYLCDFSASGDDQLISLSDARVAAGRAYPDSEVFSHPLVMGVDPARFGDDRSVIVLRQGLRMEEPIVRSGCDNMALAGLVANTIEARDPDAVFIDAGAGSGVIDRLRQLDFSVVEVPFGGRAMQPTLYANRRCEMWMAVAEWIRSGGAIPRHSTLQQELATPTYSFDAQGRRVLESKDEIRARLQGASPDIADALALTFASAVRKQLPREVRETNLGLGQVEYDPYAEARQR